MRDNGSFLDDIQKVVDFNDMKSAALWAIFYLAVGTLQQRRARVKITSYTLHATRYK